MLSDAIQLRINVVFTTTCKKDEDSLLHNQLVDAGGAGNHVPTGVKACLIVKVTFTQNLSDVSNTTVLRVARQTLSRLRILHAVDSTGDLAERVAATIVA